MVGVAAALLSTGDASAGHRSGFDVSILVDGSPRREYHHVGTTFVEALRGREYVVRISNPTSRRVAVALAVDGLNTIDAKHTSAKNAAKWVIDPNGVIEISGWQVSERAARSFYFTGERDSYGAALGQVDNLGVIEAVFFLEKEPEVSWWSPWRRSEAERQRDAAGAPSAEGARRGSAESKAQAAPSADDDFAATGMGDRHRHDVRAVKMRLEDRPAASVRIRYEFRKQLVELGVLPEPVTPLDRRERASGFAGFCPEPGS
jgi:hypothetical protein